MKTLAFVLFFCCLCLSGCGQKGPLVPPPPASSSTR
ncbi:MAG: lipoprotein [Pseudomonadales bacterium]|nr:lipoprotein [Pseudomonadales bacterium]